jgi:hypothetical protein
MVACTANVLYYTVLPCSIGLVYTDYQLRDGVPHLSTRYALGSTEAVFECSVVACMVFGFNLLCWCVWAVYVRPTVPTANEFVSDDAPTLGTALVEFNMWSALMIVVMIVFQWQFAGFCAYMCLVPWPSVRAVRQVVRDAHRETCEVVVAFRGDEC